MSDSDTAYGGEKRLAFCAQLLQQAAPKLVLDVGCGTGTGLTRPLALTAPDTQFVGVDSDEASLEYARRACPPQNLTYASVKDLQRYAGADLIIASEVLEHVEDPDAFLGELRSLLGSSGQMLITVPNGWGPFEVATLLEIVLRLSGVFALLRRLKRWMSDSPPLDRLGEDTLAVSPHINFFSWRDLRRIFERAGLAATAYRPRTFLCGFVFDPLLKALGLIDWNVRVADRLPPHLVSDWMFVLKPTRPLDRARYRRGAFNRWRRRLNERRWGVT